MADPAPAVDTGLDIDLAQYIQVLSRRRWIIAAVFTAVVLGAAVFVYTARPVYQSTAMILIEKEKRPQAFNTEGMMVETSADDYYQTQYRLLTSRSLMKTVYERLKLSEEPEFPGGPGSLAGLITITPLRSSRLVNISAESFSPELAAKIANGLAEAFVDQNIESKLYISKDILRALFPDGESAAPSAARRPVTGYESLPPVVNNPLIQNLKGAYADLEARYGELSGRYTPEHPELIRLKSQMTTLKTRLDAETLKVIDVMKADLSGRLLGNNVRIVDPAEVPGGPFKPRKSRTLTLAALLGLFGGYLIALGIDALDQTLHTQEDIERRLGLAFLGSVPKATLTGDSAAIYSELLSGPKSFTGEALKNIRTMIGFSAAGREQKVMLVTSTGQGEGKTFMAVSLAMVVAQLGEKVLLIEGDLRRPNLHRRFQVSREQGLSHFLAHSQDAEEASALVRPSGTPNLDVLICGHIPPNPSELLSTPRAGALVQWARTRYDRILIDGTPIFPITDALLWGHHADAALFVVKFGATNATLATKAVQKLRESKLRLAGSVVNQVTSKAGSYGDYYYYYYYYHSDYAEEGGKKGKKSEPSADA
ncbi:MAG: polysaccharide biosynthesis tyrosine autokinase [Elusimicrobia bacterium]|nr:polysaccharide biosynthesis tyrosine autokinase [Elusimicrobiota bacterium]